MTLAIEDAEAILRSRLGEPAKPPTNYVVGFTTPSGKLLAIHREAKETRIWFQPPAPPSLDGVRLTDKASNGNSNINGPLLPLRAPTTLRVEVDSPGALHRFLDWYAASKGAAGTIAKAAGDKGEGRILGGRETSILAMCLSVENTVKNANGQIVQRILKNKELRMTSAELRTLIASLLDLQDNRCALTGIPLQFLDSETDKNLLASVDRIDSAGHYEVGNLQVVCQFINFWKSDCDNAEFKRLLMLVRGVEQ